MEFMDAELLKNADDVDGIRKVIELLRKTSPRPDRAALVIKNIARALAKAKSAMVFFSSGFTGSMRHDRIYLQPLSPGRRSARRLRSTRPPGLNNLHGGNDMASAPIF
jgi:hypothetical protein